MKILKNVLLALVPLISSTILFIGWLYLFGFYRNSFYFPWGNEGQIFTDTGWVDLAIFDGVQFFFIACLFAVSIYVYGRCCRNMALSESHKWLSLALISISWAIFCLFAYVGSTIFCCPGFLPEVSNSLYWLTDPEFIIFYGLGQIYLFMKIKRLGNELSM